MDIGLQTTSVADRAYGRIRGDIVFGRLAPGRKLRLDKLARDYAASVSTLREILSRLSSEGLVDAEGQRGFQVAPVSPEGFQDVAAMRLLLESHALAQSFAAGDLEWEGDVVAAHHKLASLERRMLSGERDEAELWKRYDRQFHQALIAACGSQTLLDVFGGVYDQFLRYQMVGIVFRGAAAAAEHALLLDCALKRDPARACEVLTRHVEACVAHTLESGSLS
jgi:DNA-binding GntR family transcriptional regulator